MNTKSQYRILYAFVESIETNDSLFKQAVLEGIDAMGGVQNPPEELTDEVVDRESDRAYLKWHFSLVDRLADTWLQLRRQNKKESDIRRHIRKTIRAEILARLGDVDSLEFLDTFYEVKEEVAAKSVQSQLQPYEAGHDAI